MLKSIFTISLHRLSESKGIKYNPNKSTYKPKPKSGYIASGKLGGCSLHKTGNGIIIKGNKKSLETFFDLMQSKEMREAVKKWLFSSNVMAKLEEFNPSYRKYK